MEKSTANHFRQLFHAYVASYKSDEADCRRNFDLKKKHTLRVCGLIKEIGRDLGLNEKQRRFSEIIALFHDIGRFEQYARYSTFSDSRSLDHAELGVQVLIEKGFLDALDASSRELMLKTISNHNKAEIPQSADETCLFFSRLLRDADKLDIWRVVTEYYRQKAHGEKNHAIELGLPDTAGFSEKVCRDILSRRVVDMRGVRNLNDFKLVQVGWVYDLNFKPSFKRLEKKGYLTIIRRSLPDTAVVREIFTAVASHMDENCGAAPQKNRYQWESGL